MPIIGSDPDGDICVPCVVIGIGLLVTAPNISYSPTNDHKADAIGIANAKEIQKLWLTAGVAAPALPQMTLASLAKLGLGGSGLEFAGQVLFQTTLQDKDLLTAVREVDYFDVVIDGISPSGKLKKGTLIYNFYEKGGDEIVKVIVDIDLKEGIKIPVLSGEKTIDQATVEVLAGYFVGGKVDELKDQLNNMVGQAEKNLKRNARRRADKQSEVIDPNLIGLKTLKNGTGQLTELGEKSLGPLYEALMSGQPYKGDIIMDNNNMQVDSMDDAIPVNMREK